MTTPRIEEPLQLKFLANHAFVLFFLERIKLHLASLESCEFKFYGLCPYLNHMSSDLWPLYANSRKHKPKASNTDRTMIDILNYVDCNFQKSECGYFCKEDFVLKMNFQSTRLRALLDFS